MQYRIIYFSKLLVHHLSKEGRFIFNETEYFAKYLINNSINNDIFESKSHFHNFADVKCIIITQLSFKLKLKYYNLLINYDFLFWSLSEIAFHLLHPKNIGIYIYKNSKKINLNYTKKNNLNYIIIIIFLKYKSKLIYFIHMLEIPHLEYNRFSFSTHWLILW